MPETLTVPNCIDVPRKRWGWHWKAFERARYPSYQRNRSLFGKMLNRIYDIYVDGFIEGSTYDMGIRRADQKFRTEAPGIIEETYITAYQNTARDFAQGFEQNHQQKQLFDLLVGDEPEEPTEEEDEAQDVATLALLAVRDFFTAAMFAGQQSTLQSQVANIVGTHSVIAKRVLDEQAAQVLGIPSDAPLPNMTTAQINSIALSARNRFRSKVTPRHSNYFSVTETVAASNLGTLAVARARQQRTGQILTKFWLSQRDSRVRDTHVLADSQQLPLSGLFNVGGSLLAFPGDWTHGAQLKEIINCRCVLIYFSQN